jgi:hypothetical protein
VVQRILAREILINWRLTGSPIKNMGQAEYAPAGPLQQRAVVMLMAVAIGKLRMLSAVHCRQDLVLHSDRCDPA